MAANDANRGEGPTTLVSWLKRTIRYALHLLVFYQIARFSRGSLVGFVYGTVLPAVQGHPVSGSSMQFLFSHNLVFSLVPSFLAALAINAKFHHSAARWVWILPIAVLAFAFIFVGPGIYPTMIFDSNFGQAFRHFFGTVAGVPPIRNFKDMTGFDDWWRVRDQFQYTMPAYAGVGYSLGAWLGMSEKARALQAFMEKL
jgi:hypothetical protein